VNGTPVSVIHDPCYLTLVCSVRLHLPAEIVPSTHKKAVRPSRPAAPARGPQRDGDSGTYRPPRERDEYRKKEGGAPDDFKPRYAGVGRGGPRE
jgi:small subunit ribosomal protein S10e